MVPRENKNNACAKFLKTNKEYYGIFEIGLIGAAGFRRTFKVSRVTNHVPGN